MFESLINAFAVAFVLFALAMAGLWLFDTLRPRQPPHDGTRRRKPK